MRAIRLVAGCIMVGAVSVGAFAQERASPYDTHPECTERTTSGTAPECVLPAEGEPRQTYPPSAKTAPKPPPAKKPPAPPPSSPPMSGGRGESPARPGAMR